jgi:hypothetical protein
MTSCVVTTNAEQEMWHNSVVFAYVQQNRVAGQKQNSGTEHQKK